MKIKGVQFTTYYDSSDQKKYCVSVVHLLPRALQRYFGESEIGWQQVYDGHDFDIASTAAAYGRNQPLLGRSL